MRHAVFAIGCLSLVGLAAEAIGRDRPILGRFRSPTADRQGDSTGSGTTRGGVNAPTAAVDYDANVIAAEIRNAVQTNPALHGAWMDVETTAPGEYVFQTVILDASRAAEQRKLLNELAWRWVPSGKFKFDPNEELLPLSDVLAQLREQTETSVDLAGCVIDYGFYAPLPNSPDTLAIYLAGRVANENQTDAVAAVLTNLMKQDPRWAGDKPSGDTSTTFEPLRAVSLRFSVVTRSDENEKLVLVPGNSTRALGSFSAGMQAYYRGDNDTARAWFKSAAVDDPRNAMYRYWWAVCELNDDDRDGALAQLKVAGALKAGSSVSNSEINLSLRRVQGSVRQTLRELQIQAAAESAMALAGR